MSLLRLLTAGKSLIGIENPERRFRMSHPGAMPKFGPAKNWSNLKTEAGQAPPGPSADASSLTKGEQIEAVACENLAGESRCEREKVELAHPECAGGSARRVPPPDSRPGVALKRPGGWMGSWGSKLSSLAPRARTRTGNGARARMSEPPVQGELSLDNIKVLRNDLSETDLEVVTGKQVEAAAGSGTLEEPKRPSVEPVFEPRRAKVTGEARWERVATLFRAGKP